MATWLAYLGVIPFVIGVTLISFGYQQFFLINDLAFMVSSYGLVIVVFMSGIHWGNYLSDEKSHSLNLLIASNLITLISWFAFLLISTELTLLIYCITFSALLYIDAKLLSLQVISKRYFKVRCVVTLIVVISLLLTILNLVMR
ncbi:MAG: DUF3429 domain-containing protein [Gammaproteobacteria bacterium]|nr:DUF3429 domain-containing protein [Gammaproteobacteria bacterium]